MDPRKCHCLLNGLKCADFCKCKEECNNCTHFVGCDDEDDDIVDDHEGDLLGDDDED